MREPRSIPGSRKLVVIATGHHSPPEGAVAVVDPSQGANNPPGLHYVTPRCSPLEGGLGPRPTVAEGGVPDRGGFYRTPWPLSEKGFLVSYAYHSPGTTSYAAYYIDVWGNKELIHRDPAHGRVASHAGPPSAQAAACCPPGSVRSRIMRSATWTT